MTVLVARADGFGLQVYHVTDGQSKGMRIDWFQSLSQNHEEGRLPMIDSDLFTYDLDQHPLPPPAVELPVDDPLLGAKIQPAVGDGD